MQSTAEILRIIGGAELNMKMNSLNKYVIKNLHETMKNKYT